MHPGIKAQQTKASGCVGHFILSHSQSYLIVWSGIFFGLARCGYTLRVTSQAWYDRSLHTGVPVDLDPRRFGPQSISTSRFGPPGPNLLVDMDPRGSKSTSRYGPLLADLDPPSKVKYM